MRQYGRLSWRQLGLLYSLGLLYATFTVLRLYIAHNQIKSNQIKSLFESGKSPYTQTHTRIHKTQYTIKEETMRL